MTTDIAELQRLSDAKKIVRPPAPKLGNTLRNELPASSCVMDDERAERYRQDDERRKEQERRQRFAASGFPELHRQHDLDAMLQQQSKWGDATRRVMELVNEGKIVALCGPRGTGKTQAATCIAWQLSATKGVRYRRIVEVFRQVRDAFNQRDVSEASIIASYRDVGLLILDECHEKAGSEFEQRIITEIIDLRYTARKPTILITNLKPDAFRKSLGDSIASRMDEAGAVVEFAAWPSFRKGKA